MKYFLMIWAFVTLTVFAVLGWRGKTSKQPPLYLFPDMDIQSKSGAQAQSTFFKDSRVDRSPVPGTVVRGQEFDRAEVFAADYAYDKAENPEIHTGKNADGSWVKGFPVPVDEAFIRLGQQKFNTFCVVCHGSQGDGKGVLASDGSDYTLNRGYFGNIANLTSQTFIDYEEGKIFDRITNGWNTMYPYKDKLVPMERWAVVAYVRALQLAANGTVNDVPEADRKALGL